MFLVQHDSSFRTQKIRGFLGKDADGPIAIVLAAIHFEWVVSRAILVLSKAPTRDVKEALRKTFGIDRYKDLWKRELVGPVGLKTLPNCVTNWVSVRDALDVRNRIAHGGGSATANWARKHANALIKAADELDKLVQGQGFDPYSKLKSRPRPRKKP
jgi:hypothetical protein